MDVREILDFIRHEEHYKSDEEVANLFGVTRQAIDAWKRKKKVPEYVNAYYNKLLKERSLRNKISDVREMQYKSKGETMNAENPVIIDKDKNGNLIMVYINTGKTFIWDTTEKVWVETAKSRRGIAK